MSPALGASGSKKEKVQGVQLTKLKDREPSAKEQMKPRRILRNGGEEKHGGKKLNSVNEEK